MTNTQILTSATPIPPLPHPSILITINGVVFEVPEDLAAITYGVTK